MADARLRVFQATVGTAALHQRSETSGCIIYSVIQLTARPLRKIRIPEVLNAMLNVDQSGCELLPISPGSSSRVTRHAPNQRRPWGRGWQAE